MDSLINSLENLKLEDGNVSNVETLSEEDSLVRQLEDLKITRQDNTSDDDNEEDSIVKQLEDNKDLLMTKDNKQDNTSDDDNGDLIVKQLEDNEDLLMTKDNKQDNTDDDDDIDALLSCLSILDTQSDENKNESSDNDSWNSYYKLLDSIDNHKKFSTDFNWDSNSESDAGAGDFKINFDCIFDDVANLAKAEKLLDLLYRPFTCVMDSNCRFNMYDLCILMADSRYEPGAHPSVAIKVRCPMAVVKVYEGGKIVSTALTAESARNALLNVVKMVQALDFKAEINIFRHNIVNASFCMPFKLDLEMLAELHKEHVSYNIKTRPFLTYSIEGTAIRFAVFASGFVLVLHSSMHSETRAAIDGFLPILADFNNGVPTTIEKNGIIFGDITYKLIWEHKLEEDRNGVLLYN